MMPWVDREQWPWEGRLVDVGEGRLHVTEVGTGPTVLFVHGTPTWSFEWRHLVRALSASFRCVLVDHLGFGQSERPEGAGYRPEDHARRLERLVEVLGLDRFTLVVHDFGGPIGLPLALRPGRVERVVIINTFAWELTDRSSRFRGWLIGTALFRWLYRYANFSVRFLAPSAWGDRRKLTPAIQAQYLAPWEDRDGRERVLYALAKALLGSGPFYRSLWERRGALAELPVLLVWGLADHAFGPEYLAVFRAALPHAEVLTLDGAGHWPHEEEPQQVAQAVQRFLAAAPSA
jgi:haloalkane dehalogenase